MLLILEIQTSRDRVYGSLSRENRAIIYVTPNTYDYYYKFSSITGTRYESRIGILDSGWHHTVVVFDGSRLRVYVDGVARGDVSAPGVIDKVDDSLFIGTAGTGASPAENYFSGMLDEVRVYSSVLSASDVQSEYDTGKAEH